MDAATDNIKCDDMEILNEYLHEADTGNIDYAETGDTECNVYQSCYVRSIGKQEDSVQKNELILECDDQQKPQKGNSMENGGLVPTVTISKLSCGNKPPAEEAVEIGNTGCFVWISNFIKEVLERHLPSKYIIDTSAYVYFYSTPPTGYDIKYLDINVVKVVTRKRVRTFVPDEVPALVAKMKTKALVFDPGGDS